MINQSSILDDCKRIKQLLLSISHKSNKYNKYCRAGGKKYELNQKVDSQQAQFDHLGTTQYPFALLLGNHSSGKSTFINSLCERDVQSTGVAPTDDCFTIIISGNEDQDRSGFALVGDPDLGFDGLQTFGPVLINHTKLKVRKGIANNDFMLVDSPGMIDSRSSADSRSSLEVNSRGYNFEGVCRWYAKRADVILLFFDPEKPGTTGETLSVLTTSLAGMDHKLHIILNKADKFERVSDFARTYGSLCWSMSKVIKRKDLPQIHTICNPPNSNDSNNYETNSNNNNNNNDIYGDNNDNIRGNDLIKSVARDSSNSQTDITRQEEEKVVTSSLDSPNNSNFYKNNNNENDGVKSNDSKYGLKKYVMDDLLAARKVVVEEVFNSPKRRIDNEVARLTESTTALMIQLSLVDDIARRYNRKKWTGRIISLLTGVVCVCITFAASSIIDTLIPSPPSKSASHESDKVTVSEHDNRQGDRSISNQKSQFLVRFSGTLLGMVMCSGTVLWQTLRLQSYAKKISSREYLRSSFHRLFGHGVASLSDRIIKGGEDHNDEYFLSVGETVIDQ
eukprot:gene14906-20050_t